MFDINSPIFSPTFSQSISSSAVPIKSHTPTKRSLTVCPSFAQSILLIALLSQDDSFSAAFLKSNVDVTLNTALMILFITLANFSLLFSVSTPAIISLTFSVSFPAVSSKFDFSIAS